MFWRRLDALVTSAIRVVCCVLLVLMVVFTAYTIIMRYVFLNPPFWGDTVTMFANIWLVMLSFALAVRDDEHIAMRGLYTLISPAVAISLEIVWTLLIVVLGVVLAWYGYEAAMRVPGQFWELGGFPKRYPTMIMPIAGVLVAAAAGINLGRHLGRLSIRSLPFK